jgi:hypothetical protein
MAGPSSSAAAAQLSSFSAAADAAHLDDDSNDWKALRTTVVANQAVDLPELGSFNLCKLTPPLKERADPDIWIDQVDKVLRGYNLHHLNNKNIPWPKIRDPNGKKWHTLSLQVRSWLSNSIDHTVMQEINARGSDPYYADELFAEIKIHMKREGHGAIKTAMDTFLDLSRSQFSTSEEYIDALKLAYKAICDLHADIPPYHALQMMLSQLAEVQELNSFIVVKDNELNAIEKPVQTVTIADFYRYSNAILDYIKYRQCSNHKSL